MFRRDQWLSEVLDLTCFGGNIRDGASTTSIKAAMADVAPSGRAFFAVKQSISDIASVETLVRAGFNVVDVSVTLAHDGQATVASVADGVEVDPAAPEDEVDIVDVAGRCFVHSRFHADRRIGRERADRIKREWVRNSCRGRAVMVYVARRADEIAGFLAAMKLDGKSGVRAAIDLIGVDAKFQGQGIGRSLGARFVNDWRNRADRLVVGTQVANIPALRLYESLGFRVSEAGYALHAHLQDGELTA